MASWLLSRSCRKLFFGVAILVFLFEGLHLAGYHLGFFPKSPSDLYRDARNHTSPALHHVFESGTQYFSNSLTKKINPAANWFNRPESLVVPKDDYMGTRPHIDTVANITLIVEQCRGSYEKIEKMPYVYDCLKFLADNEQDYYYLPSSGSRASEQSPKDSEYMNSDNALNTLPAYPSQRESSPSSIGHCHGPITPYHAYWTGPATWRVEIFIKSYLYTQNLPCSRLYIWLDGDRDPLAVQKMLTTDPLFAQFLPLVTRGDLILKTWTFPTRIALPPGDNTDGVGYYSTPRPRNVQNESFVAPNLIHDAEGQEWLLLSKKQMTFLPVAVSDAVRFVVLHHYGGLYLDMDVLLLRDMRPLLIAPNQHNFAERWGAWRLPGDYNTAILSLTANSSLSSYLVRGGVRMGMNFHPRVIGAMAVKDGRNHELEMLETATVDPIWTEDDDDRLGRCTIPCIHDYPQVFEARERGDEWDDFEGAPADVALVPNQGKGRNRPWPRSVQKGVVGKNGMEELFDVEALRNTPYKIEEDQYPPTNRTLENFFKGAWSYHVHNQWKKHPEPSSWLNVLQRAQDGFFSAGRMNPYGEKWMGPVIPEYEVSWEFV